MRFAAALTTVVLAAAFLADAAPAADDPTPTLRDDVDALVKAVTAGASPAEGPSPTTRVNRLVAAGDARLRPVLAEAWQIVTSVTSAHEYAPATRTLVRFLYSIPDSAKSPPAGGATLLEEDGAVRVRRVAASGAPVADSKPPFAALVKGGRLRRQAKPDLVKLLAAFDADAVAADERTAVAQAVGEASRADKQAMADLLRQFAADPASAWLTTALASSGSPDAETPLRDEVASLAARAAAGDEAASGRLAGACRALGRLRSDALVDVLGSLAGGPRDAALAAVGFDVATGVEVAAAERASDAPARTAALSAVCRRIIDTNGDVRASAATTTALAKLFAARVEDVEPSLRASVLAAAEVYLFGARGLSLDPTGERVGPYPDMAKTLASIAKDLASGDLLFTDHDDASIFELASRPPPAEWQRLRSVVIAPGPSAPDAPDAPPRTVELRGEVFGQWLRLALKNVGPTPITVDPTALRYGTAECTRHELYGGPGVARTYRRLKLTLGFMRASVATPAARLATLQPNEQFPWVIDLRAADRGVESICVEMFPDFDVRGTPAAPQLTGFTETWVK